MAARIRVSLIKVPGKKKRAIQLALNAGFRSQDSITGEVKYQTLKIQLKHRILPQFWNVELGRPAAEYSARDRFKLHRYLDEQVNFLTQAHEQVMDNPLIELVTTRDVKQCYLQMTGQLRKVQVQSRIPHFVNDYVAKSKSEKYSTQVQFTLLATRMRMFESESKQACYWQNYTLELHEEFLAWLQTRFDLSVNTIWNWEKLIFKFRSIARERGLLNDANEWRRTTRYQQTDKMYLDWEMVRKLMDFEAKTPQMRNTKSVFLLLLFTGIRVGDLHKFVMNYHDDVPFGWSRFRLSKSPCPEVVIPCAEPVRQIMLNDRPHDVSISTLHRRIKLLLTKVFDKETAARISAHTARRSFITNLLPFVQESVLRRVVGHSIPSATRVFASYDRLSIKDNAVLFMKQLRNIPVEETAGIRLARFTEEIQLN